MQIHFHQGQDIGNRDEQQDALGNLLLSSEHKLYVLADGMGGPSGGRMASQTAVKAFLDYCQQQAEGVDVADMLMQALQHANRALADGVQQQPALNGMGTTLLAVWVDETRNRYTYLSVGDSPLYRLGQGRLQRINANHALYEDLKKLVAAGEMTQEEADRHPGRHTITSAVMGEAIPFVDTGSGSLQPGELLLLASDGVESLSDDEIAQVLSVSGSLEQKVAQLLQAVRAKRVPHQDNVSVILVAAAEPAAVSTVSPETVAGDRVPTERKTERQTMAAQTAVPPAAASRRRWPSLLVGIVLGIVAGMIVLVGWPQRQGAEPQPVTPPAASVPAMSLPGPDLVPVPASAAAAASAASSVPAPASAPRSASAAD